MATRTYLLRSRKTNSKFPTTNQKKSDLNLQYIAVEHEHCTQDCGLL